MMSKGLIFLRFKLPDIWIPNCALQAPLQSATVLIYQTALKETSAWQIWCSIKPCKWVKELFFGESLGVYKNIVHSIYFREYKNTLEKQLLPTRRHVHPGIPVVG